MEIILASLFSLGGQPADSLPAVVSVVSAQKKEQKTEATTCAHKRRGGDVTRCD